MRVRGFGSHLATHRQFAGKFVVKVAPPYSGGRGMTVSSWSGMGPSGEFARLRAAGWVFRPVDRAALRG